MVGLICHKYGASGGDSESEPPDVERRLLPSGGEPMANCTAGGEIELAVMNCTGGPEFLDGDELMSTADGAVAGAVFAFCCVLLLR